MLLQIGRVLLIASVIILLHAGYSAWEHVRYLKQVGSAQLDLTSEIIAQVFFALTLGVFAIVLSADDPEPISLQHELRKKSRDAFESRPSYRSFGHRGRHFAAVLAASHSVRGGE